MIRRVWRKIFGGRAGCLWFVAGLVVASAVAITLALTAPTAPPAPRAVPEGIGADLRTAKRVLLRDASLVLTMDPALGEGPLGAFEDADVLFADGVIEAVGPALDPRGARVIDVAGQIVMPGLIDVHDHLWQVLIRGCATDRSLPGWLNSCVFPMMSGMLSRADAAAAVQLGTVGLIETGVTAVLDFGHGFTDDFALGNLDALEASGLRFVLAHGGAANEGFARQLIQRMDAHPTAMGLQIGGHPSAMAFEALKEHAALARALDVPLNVHLLEHISDRDEQQLTLLEQVGALEHPLVVAHAIHLTDTELDLLAHHRVRAVHNPASNMRLGSGVMRLGAMDARGITLGLGLDGGTNDTPDAFANMRAAIGLQRAAHHDVAVAPSVDGVLRLATLGGAEVLGLADDIGSLTPGKRADVIVIDPSGPHFAPRGHWPSQLVFNARPSDVTLVFVDGKALKAEGRVLGVDVPALVRQNEAIAARIERRRAGLGAVIDTVLGTPPDVGPDDTPDAGP